MEGTRSSDRVESTSPFLYTGTVGSILGEKGDVIRQIFSVPEQVDGAPFSVLELIERHAGYQGFSPPQADALMQSTVKT